jgi:hypothetical protein
MRNRRPRTLDVELRVKIIEACANREPLLGLLDRLDAAARERPSALDVEALAEAMHAEHPSTFPAMGCCGGMARRIVARLTEPDAVEGTER